MPKMPPAVVWEKCPPGPRGDRPTHQEPLAARPAERTGILEFRRSARRAPTLCSHTVLPHGPPARSPDKRRIHFGHNRHTERSAAPRLRSDAPSLHPASSDQIECQTGQAGSESSPVACCVLWSPHTAKRLELESEFQGRKPASLPS